jgi:hypothetical protein
MSKSVSAVEIITVDIMPENEENKTCGTIRKKNRSICLKDRALHLIVMTEWELIKILSGNLGKSNKSMRRQTSTQPKTSMKGNHEKLGNETSRRGTRKIKHPETNREERSLGTLARKFVKMIYADPTGTMDLNIASNTLGLKRGGSARSPTLWRGLAS